MTKLLPILAVVAFATVASPALAANPRIALENRSGDTVETIEMSNIDAGWGSDLIPTTVLPNGYEISTLVPTDPNSGYCRYDLRVTFASGDAWVFNDFNACTTARIYIRERSFDLVDINNRTTNRRPMFD